ncbi:Glutathione S-transferase-like isoform X2 [Aix galericulata]|nr:Glutathione S-transferase-like isoform X2 [Aix galericulata]
MSGKPRLTYINGRGRMEPVRWLLAAAGVEFEENFVETKEQLEKLVKGGDLLFQQVPMVEIDGMKMVQTRAILSYIAGKYNLYGKDLKERALIDMYVEGITDLMQMVLMFPFTPAEAKAKSLASIEEKATKRYFPVFEKILKQHGQDFLVGNRLSWADVQLLEAILAVEEKVPAVLSGFPQLQAFKTKMSNVPTIKKFLQPGSARKPPPDENYVALVVGNQTRGNMSGKPRLHYVNARGRMESIRWLLAAAGVEFEEAFLETKDDLKKLQTNGDLLFQQVPMVEIDGMKMVQTRAILSYIAGKYNLYGKDLKERALIDMYVEGLADLNELITSNFFQPADKKEEHLATVMDKAATRYFPVYEKVLKGHGQDFLVGNKLSRADVQLLEIILLVEEFKPDILAKFPLLQSFKAKTSNIPNIKKFLQPGSQRKQPIQEKDIPRLMQIFH